MILTFLFSDVTYVLAMMQKVNWSVCWNSDYWNVWTFPWVGTVFLIPPSLSLSLPLCSVIG
jgi:hypothetical protein